MLNPVTDHRPGDSGLLTKRHNMKVTHIALLLTSASASIAQAESSPSSTEGFGVAQPMSLVPVSVCMPGEQPSFSAGSWKCPGGHQTVSPERYVELRCPGAVLSTYDLVGGRSGLSVVMRFKLPQSGCEEIRDE